MFRWVPALVLLAASASAQVITGSVVGTVVDETGGVLPGVDLNRSSDLADLMDT